jgi:head-tail adaptor
MAAPLGQRRHLVTLDEPIPVPDGDGGYVNQWRPLAPPAWMVRIRPAGPADQERATAGTVTATATHVLEGYYHPGVTLKTRVTYGARVFSVIYVGNVDERSVSMELLAAERVT